MVISSREETVISLGMTLSPVHITSMSGANFDPIVFRYSDVAILIQNISKQAKKTHKIKFYTVCIHFRKYHQHQQFYRRDSPSCAILRGAEKELWLAKVLVDLVSHRHLINCFIGITGCIMCIT